jgi:hypothetical protein
MFALRLRKQTGVGNANKAAGHCYRRSTQPGRDARASA